MARKKSDRGRNFYETSSPFETYEGSSRASKPKTYSGLVDDTPVSSRLINGISGQTTMRKLDPEQYDNPRGYPGLALVTTGEEKSKLPLKSGGHSISHQMEGGASLPRTGKR